MPTRIKPKLIRPYDVTLKKKKKKKKETAKPHGRAYIHVHARNYYNKTIIVLTRKRRNW